MKNVAFLVDQGIASSLDPYPASWNALPPVPKGVSVSTSADGWTITASCRSGAGFDPWIFVLGCGVIAAYMWLMPSETAGTGVRVAKYIFAIFALIWIPDLLRSVWGVDIIQKRGPDLFIRSKLWKWMQTDHMGWDELHQIRMRHDEGRRRRRSGRRIFTRSIELTSNRIITFGDSLSDEQRAYIAMFLLQKANADGESLPGALN